MRANVYLSFNGNCATAFKFYEQALGAKILMCMTYGESPMGDKTPEAMRNAVIHARIAVGDTFIMGSDAPPDRQTTPQGFSVAINTEDPAEADRVFAAMSANGTVTMPIQETFWAKRFGMLIDQFGIAWMVNCEKPMAGKT
jgi:PhnB protein